MRLQTELTEMYLLINKLFLICMKKKLKLIVENPYSEEHYLRRYWCYPPSIIDKDRRTDGDYYKKPTQYWFVNFEPKNNLVMGSYNNAIDCKDPIKKMKKEHYTILIIYLKKQIMRLSKIILIVKIQIIYKLLMTNQIL